MQLSILAGFILLTGVTTFADDGNVLKGGDKTKEPSIVKVLPEEYAAYEKALAQSNGTHLARASLDLLAKAKELLGRDPSPSDGTQNHTNAYRATWRLCVRTMQDSKDLAVHLPILNQWNKFLKADDDAVPLQVYTLAEQWDRSLLSDEFWNTLQHTKNQKTVHAIGYVLYQHGNQDDLDRMVKIEKETPGRGLPNAISWLRYRLSPDKTNPGPAAAPPKME